MHQYWFTTSPNNKKSKRSPQLVTKIFLETKQSPNTHTFIYTYIKIETYLPTHSLRSSSVFSHFLMNFPGSTSSVLHCDFTTFLVEHRSPDLGFRLSLTSPADELLSSGSSSFHTHPILPNSSLSSASLRFSSLPRKIFHTILGGFCFYIQMAIGGKIFFGPTFKAQKRNMAQF